MLRETSGNIDDGGSPTWDAPSLPWRAVDRALRGIARRRGKLDADEARWLREAERLQIWRPLGMVSALDYLERVLGYTPHVAKERLRVARALGELPVLTDAFARGELAFSAIRELTRVATRATESRWRDTAVGKNARQIEELVAGHRHGDTPDDPADPEIRTHVVRFELGAEVFARLRQTRAALTEDRGDYVDDDQLVTALCDAVLDRAAGPSTEPTGRAKFQIAVTVCERCDRAWQEGGGATVPIDVAALERARCDAQHIGSIDGQTPERASQDIPPRVVRLVWRRDHGRCQTPGCRSSTGLEIHHVLRRADGGSHAPSNLRIQCSGCHLALHRGTLAITRTTSGRLEVQRGEQPGADAGVGATLEATIVRTQARDALVGLGWKPAIARAAVDEAWSHVGPAVRVETLIREALRRCPKPMG
ncbi:MAG: HNH endonuclease [Candidatus Binatia bacterium]